MTYLKDITNFNSNWIQKEEYEYPINYYLGWGYLINKNLLDVFLNKKEYNEVSELVKKILNYDFSLSGLFDFKDKQYNYDNSSWEAINPKNLLVLYSKIKDLKIDYILSIGLGATCPGILLAQIKKINLVPILFSIKKLKMKEPIPRDINLEGVVLILEEDNYTGETINKLIKYIKADKIYTSAIITHYLTKKPNFYGLLDFK